MTFNAIDAIIVIALLAALIIGYRRGLISQLISLLGFVLAYYIAYRFADMVVPYLAAWLPMDTFTGYEHYEYALRASKADVYILRALAFVLVFLAVRAVLSVLGHLLNLVAKVPGLNALNRWGGALLGVAEAALLTVIAVYALSVVPSDPIQKALSASWSAPYIMKTVPAFLRELRLPDPADRPDEPARPTRSARLKRSAGSDGLLGLIGPDRR